eukprot:5968756-Prymnesium_polylepis.1
MDANKKAVACRGSIKRSKQDRPAVCAAPAQWPCGAEGETQPHGHCAGRTVHQIRTRKDIKQKRVEQPRCVKRPSGEGELLRGKQ